MCDQKLGVSFLSILMMSNVTSIRLIGGSLGIAATRNYAHIPKIGFVVAGGGFYSYYIHQRNISDKERKIVRKKLSFIHTKRFDTYIFKKWVQLHVYPNYLIFPSDDICILRMELTAEGFR